MYKPHLRLLKHCVRGSERAVALALFQFPPGISSSKYLLALDLLSLALVRCPALLAAELVTAGMQAVVTPAPQLGALQLGMQLNT